MTPGHQQQEGNARDAVHRAVAHRSLAVAPVAPPVAWPGALSGVLLFSVPAHAELDDCSGFAKKFCASRLLQVLAISQKA
jgi:hypothetical protein